MIALLAVPVVVAGIVFENRPWTSRVGEDSTPINLDDDLPCPWCFAPTRENDASCPSCGRRFGLDQ